MHNWDVTTKWVLPAAGHWAFTSLLQEQFQKIIWFESEARLCFNKCGYDNYLFRRMCGLILPKWDLFIAEMTRKALPAVEKKNMVMFVWCAELGKSVPYRGHDSFKPHTVFCAHTQFYKCAKKAVFATHKPDIMWTIPNLKDLLWLL